MAAAHELVEQRGAIDERTNVTHLWLVGAEAELGRTARIRAQLADAHACYRNTRIGVIRPFAAFRLAERGSFDAGVVQVLGPRYRTVAAAGPAADVVLQRNAVRLHLVRAGPLEIDAAPGQREPDARLDPLHVVGRTRSASVRRHAPLGVVGPQEIPAFLAGLRTDEIVDAEPATGPIELAPMPIQDQSAADVDTIVAEIELVFSR